MNITKRSVDALELRAQRYIAWDAALSGFGVRVEASGRKTSFVGTDRVVFADNTRSDDMVFSRPRRPAPKRGGS